MWNENEYRRQQNAIELSEEFTLELVGRMEEVKAEMMAEKSKKQKHKFIYITIGLLLLLAIILILLITINSSSATPEGQTTRDGIVQVRLTHPEAELEAFEATLNALMSDLTLTDFTLQQTIARSCQETTEPTLTYVFIRESASIQLIATRSLTDFQPNTTLDQRSLSLYYEADPEGNVYRGVFIENEIGYEVIGRGLTDEEFLEYLQDIIEFLEEAGGEGR